MVATACAVAASVLRKPVRVILSLEDNMEMVGKRCPYTCNYEVRFAMTIIQFSSGNGGCGEDLSILPLLSLSLFLSSLWTNRTSWITWPSATSVTRATPMLKARPKPPPSLARAATSPRPGTCRVKTLSPTPQTTPLAGHLAQSRYAAWDSESTLCVPFNN